ncbi:uncharacterized protein LOC144213859 isoform X2 [Stigmatopora nigra]
MSHPIKHADSQWPGNKHGRKHNSVTVVTGHHSSNWRARMIHRHLSDSSPFFEAIYSSSLGQTDGSVELKRAPPSSP